MSFEVAFQKTMKNEGVLSNDPVDPGGLTFMGISRRYWPEWEGWGKLEESGYKLTEQILENVRSFYRIHFWNPAGANEVDQLVPEIAEELFDTAVNMGTSKAVSIFQDAMNLLNITGSLYPDIAVDGEPGPRTILALRRYLSYDSPGKTVYIRRLLRVMNALQASHYIAKMRENPKKEKFRGWFDRI